MLSLTKIAQEVATLETLAKKSDDVKSSFYAQSDDILQSGKTKKFIDEQVQEVRGNAAAQVQEKLISAQAQYDLIAPHAELWDDPFLILSQQPLTDSPSNVAGESLARLAIMQTANMMDTSLLLKSYKSAVLQNQLGSAFIYATIYNQRDVENKIDLTKIHIKEMETAKVLFGKATQHLNALRLNLQEISHGKNLNLSVAALSSAHGTKL